MRLALREGLDEIFETCYSITLLIDDDKRTKEKTGVIKSLSKPSLLIDSKDGCNQSTREICYCELLSFKKDLS